MKYQDVHIRIPRPEISIERRTLLKWLPSRGNVMFTVLLVVMLFWAQSAGALPLPAAQNSLATSTGTIAYQGRLADAGGNPLTSTVNMEFRLYNVATGGTPLWSELWTGANAVQASDGLFNVMLGSLTPIPQNIVTGGDSLWLGITVGTDDEMAPRVQLGSVPFAVQALTVPDESITVGKIADGAVTSNKLTRDLTRLMLSNEIQMPIARTWYDVLSTTVTLSRETLVTINASIAPQNNATEALFQTDVLVDGSAAISGSETNPAGFGNTIMMSTSVLLGAGQHQIKLRASSWQNNGIVNSDTRTQLVVIQG